MRDKELCLSDLTAYGLARASVEGGWGEDSKSEKYLVIMEQSPFEQTSKSETKYYLKKWRVRRILNGSQ